MGGSRMGKEVPGNSALLAPGTLLSHTIPKLMLCKLFSPIMEQRREELALHSIFKLF